MTVPLLGIYLRKMKIYVRLLISTLFWEKTNHLETIQMSVIWGWVDKPPVHVVAAQSATWASPGRYAGGMKPDTKTAYWDSISSPFCKRENYRGRVLPGLRVGGGVSTMLGQHKAHFGGC